MNLLARFKLLLWQANPFLSAGDRRVGTQWLRDDAVQRSLLRPSVPRPPARPTHVSFGQIRTDDAPPAHVTPVVFDASCASGQPHKRAGRPPLLGQRDPDLNRRDARR